MTGSPGRLRRVRLASLTAVALLGLAAAGIVGWRSLQKSAAVSPHSGRAAITGAFALIDHRGRAVSNEAFKGKWMLVFFGFTHCPDVCPTALNTVALAMDALGKDAARVQPLFITVDPERDTPKVMAKYVAAFHPRIVGLTGTPAQIKEAAASFKVYYAKAAQKDAPGEYLVNHTAVLYLMDPKGEYRAHFSHRDKAADLAAGIRRYLAE